MTPLFKLKPIVLIDKKEQRPFKITRFQTERVDMKTGDYGIKGFSDASNPRIVFERKSVGDFASSFSQGADSKVEMLKVMRMTAFAWRAYIIEGTPMHIVNRLYESDAHPNTLLAMVDSLRQDYGTHVIWGGDAAGGADQVERQVYRFARGVEKDFERLGGMAK